ncbi:MAG: UTP--glucose-1-phosphate uridylyltransferase GalU [Oscillospiraceae bacterium]
MKVKKAIIPAAGFGTRVLPATKAIPKEMLPIVDKPSIQYIVEEAVRAGIEDILIITNRGKGAMEDHFDRAPELEASLKASGKDSFYNEILAIANLANIQFIRQKETKGLGHAVLQAKSFVGNEPFAVLYGDDVIIGENPVCGQLCEAYEKYGKGVVGIKTVSPELVAKYSSMKIDPIDGAPANHFSITDMIEKPAPGQEFSLYSILGRCVLPPEIFGIIENTPKGAGGEIQLTDAMKTLSNTAGMIGVDFEGTRYDIGSKLGYMQANVELALAHPEIAGDFAEYLKGIVAGLK